MGFRGYTWLNNHISRRLSFDSDQGLFKEFLEVRGTLFGGVILKH